MSRARTPSITRPARPRTAPLLLSPLPALPTLAALLSTACSWHSPIMAAAPHAALTDPPPADRARVVFVHPRYSASTSAHSVPTVRIVDERAQLLGDSLPSTWFSVDLPPGHHAFYGWRVGPDGASRQLASCSCAHRSCAEVAAMPADLLAGRTYFVTVRTTEWRTRAEASGSYAEFTSVWGDADRVDFARVSPVLAQWPAHVLSSVQPLARDDLAASAQTAKEAATYRSFACTGNLRVQRGNDWDPKVSALLPDDGSASSPTR